MARARPRKQSIGDRIAELRVAAGLRQRELASMIGISQAHLCRLELGKARLQIDVLVRIAARLGIAVSEIVEGM